MSEVQQLRENGKIVERRTEIYVPHLGEILAFGLPLTGIYTFQRAMDRIDLEKLARPTTAQTFSLLDLVLQNQDNKYCEDILIKFGSQYFWSATETLWGKEDAIVYDNVDGKMPTDRKTLMEMAKDKDKRVRIVPYGFKIQSQTVDEFVSNPYIIAQVEGKKEFAEDVVRRITSRLKNKAFIWALGPQNCDAKKYTSLVWNMDGCLGLKGDNYYEICNNGCASGVRVVKEETK